MDNDTPILFTVRQGGNYNVYSITSEDERAVRADGKPIRFVALSSYDIYRVMLLITLQLNEQNYEVIFNVG